MSVGAVPASSECRWSRPSEAARPGSHEALRAQPLGGVRHPRRGSGRAFRATDPRPAAIDDERMAAVGGAIAPRVDAAEPGRLWSPNVGCDGSSCSVPPRVSPRRWDPCSSTCRATIARLAQLPGDQQRARRPGGLRAAGGIPHARLRDDRLVAEASCRGYRGERSRLAPRRPGCSASVSSCCPSMPRAGCDARCHEAVDHCRSALPSTAPSGVRGQALAGTQGAGDRR